MPAGQKSTIRDPFGGPNATSSATDDNQTLTDDTIIEELEISCDNGNNPVKVVVPNDGTLLFFSCNFLVPTGRSHLCEWPLDDSLTNFTYVWEVCPLQCWERSGCPVPTSQVQVRSAIQRTSGCSMSHRGVVTIFGGSDNAISVECSSIGVTIGDSICDLIDNDTSVPVSTICSEQCGSQQPPTVCEAWHGTDDCDCQDTTVSFRDPRRDQVVSLFVCPAIGIFVEPFVCGWENVDTNKPIWKTCCEPCRGHGGEKCLVTPSAMPSDFPSNEPSVFPSDYPSGLPSYSPTSLPTQIPSWSPSGKPSASPTLLPSVSPSDFPSTLPSISPTESPSTAPSAPPIPWCTNPVDVVELADSAAFPCSSIGFYVRPNICVWGYQRTPVWSLCPTQCLDQCHE